MTQSRTHTCGELRLANAGETVTLTIYRGGTYYDVDVILMDRANA